MTEQTLAIIKPDAMAAGHDEEIVARLLAAGFRISGDVVKSLGRAEAEGFYKEHEGRPFFEPLIDFMTQAPVRLLVLEKTAAVASWRAMLGHTDPALAEEGTIRADFGSRKRTARGAIQNAAHGSDSPATAQREIRYFFGSRFMEGRPA